MTLLDLCIFGFASCVAFSSVTSNAARFGANVVLRTGVLSTLRSSRLCIHLCGTPRGNGGGAKPIKSGGNLVDVQ